MNWNFAPDTVATVQLSKKGVSSIEKMTAILNKNASNSNSEVQSQEKTTTLETLTRATLDNVTEANCGFEQFSSKNLTDIQSLDTLDRDGLSNNALEVNDSVDTRESKSVTESEKILSAHGETHKLWTVCGNIGKSFDHGGMENVEMTNLVEKEKACVSIDDLTDHSSSLSKVSNMAATSSRLVQNELPQDNTFLNKIGNDLFLGLLETYIVGRQFNDEVKVEQGASIFRRDPQNPKDGNAIKVFYLSSESGSPLGYLPRELAFYLSPLLDNGTLKIELIEPFLSGPWFRTSSLCYPDINDLKSACEELIVAGYMSSSESVKESSEDVIREMLEVLNVPELRQLCSMVLLKKKSDVGGAKREELLQWLISIATQQKEKCLLGVVGETCALSLLTLVSRIAGLCVNISHLARILLWRVQRLFFLNGEQDLTSFLLVDMGLRKYPNYKCNRTRCVFTNRDDLLSYERVYVRGRRLNSAIGTKNRFYGYDGQQCSVEQLALQYYAREEGGNWQGVHSEGGIWMTFFGLLMWDVLFADVPDVFHTPFQTAPLDLRTDCFYPSRESLIETQLSKIRKGGAEKILAATWEAHIGTYCQGVNWERYSLLDLQTIASCVGGPALAAVCKLLAEDYGSWASGMPDLLLWRTFSDKTDLSCEECGFQLSQREISDDQCCCFSDTAKNLGTLSPRGEAKLAEVKGPRDHLSEQQRAWIFILMDVGLFAEVCKITELPKGN